MNWNQEAIDEAMRLQNEGLSLSEIANRFGCSKNAVCGKLFREKIRLGLRPADKPRTQRKRYPPKRSKPMPEPLPVPLVLDETRFASIVDVTGCRWAVREDPSLYGGHAFCNHDQVEGSSYCAHHKAENVASYSRELIKKTMKQATYAYEAKPFEDLRGMTPLSARIESFRLRAA